MNSRTQKQNKVNLSNSINYISEKQIK